jgi:hypothetical protein
LPVLAGFSGRWLIPGLAALVSTVGLSAVQTLQPEPFRAAVDLVRLDCVALSQDGQPVTDLSAADITLKVDGRPCDIRSFQYVRLGRSSASSPAPARVPAKLLPSPFGTNALDDSGRMVVIILETDSIRANVAQQATGAGAEFVAGLSPRDWVGLVTVPYGGVLVEPTRAHERVLKVLPTITGQASQQTTDSAKGCRTRDTLTALADHLTGLAHIEGPKTIIFVSSGMLLPRRDAPITARQARARSGRCTTTRSGPRPAWRARTCMSSSRTTS